MTKAKAKPAAKNTQSTGQRGGRRRTSWKPGQSGNPNGAPKKGESWAETIRRVGDMTPAEAVVWCKEITGKLAPLGDKVTLREAVVLRVFAANVFEPQPGLVNAFMDRAEGKPAQPLTGPDGGPLALLMKGYGTVGPDSWDEDSGEADGYLQAVAVAGATVAGQVPDTAADRKRGRGEVKAGG